MEILGRQAEQRLVDQPLLCGRGNFENPRSTLGGRSCGRGGTTALEVRQSRGREEVVADDARLFVPLKLLDAATTLEIVHPLGCRIQVTGEVNPVALRQVIEALDERAAR